MDVRYFIKFVLLLVTLVGNAGFAAEKKRYISSQLDISFAYPDSWKIVPPAETATEIVIRWDTVKSNSLIAVCYVRTVRNKDAELYLSNFSFYYDELLDGFLRATRERTDELELISHKLTRVDGKDVMFTIMKIKIQNLDKVIQMRLYTVLTFWKGNEIAFECGTPLLDFDPNDLTIDERKGVIELQGKIEKTIMEILGTLHFDRTG